MKNIMIIGPPGSGKSTLAMKLAEIYTLRVIHMDHLYWKPNWVMREEDEILSLVEKEIQEDGWVFEGNHPKSYHLRVPKAGTLIWLDMPRSICLWRAFKRTIKNHGKHRSDLPPGCVDRFDWEFLTWVWNFNKNRRQRIMQLFDESRGQLKQFHLTSQADVDRYLSLISTQNKETSV